MKSSNSPIGKLSVEELLRVRYLVTNDWPGNTKYNVGDIVYGYTAGYGGGEIIIDGRGNKVWLSPENYAANFRPLAWHELRSVEEMPEYVSIENKILKVKKWIIEPESVLLSLRYPEPSFTMGSKFYPPVLPATKTDFDNYQKSKNV